jgi:hypothetical protein
MFIRDSCSKQLDSDRLAADVPYVCVCCVCVCVCVCVLCVCVGLKLDGFY